MPMMSLKDAYESAKGLYDQGSYRAAVHASEVLYKQLPHHPPVVALYVGSLLRFQQYKEGIRIAKRSLRHISHKAHRVSIISQLCDGLTQSGQLEDAIELVKTELESQPDHIALVGSLLHLLLMNDQRDEVISYVDGLKERGVEGLPIAAVFGRAVLRTDRRDEAIEWLERLIAENADASDDRLHHAYNALGHLLDKAKRYDEAMDAFNKSNALIHPAFSEERLDVIIRSVKANWSSDRFVGLQSPEPSGARPVFIVGMPRSGTTLTEQIIDAHPKGFGAGELGLISELFRDLAKSQTNPYDTGPNEYDPVKLAEAARVYREETAAMAARAGVENPEVIVDKAPMNFSNLGMIALAFPDARIIHCQRDPRDNCLSCFFQLLNAGHTYSFDLENCGKYYRYYRSLMNHYTELLASDPINNPLFENVYEDMVADQEKRTHELLSFIGLDFDPACLDFHKTGRVAITLSNDQVRQPMYKSSTKRYERYSDHIGPLVDALGDLIQDE
jgi:tetratricopeptide (TPR) repeat protein